MIGTQKGIELSDEKLRCRPSGNPLEQLVGFMLWHQIAAKEEPLCIGWGSGKSFQFRFKGTQGLMTMVMMWGSCRDGRMAMVSNQSSCEEIVLYPRFGGEFHPSFIEIFQSENGERKYQNRGTLESVIVDDDASVVVKGFSLSAFDPRRYWHELWRQQECEALEEVA